jgi:mono/diheme cytochrome c family protein
MVNRLVWLALVSLSTALSLRAATVDYSREVKPIFTQHCVRCHGEAKIEAGLRVDTAAALREGGDNGSALRPREGGESLLLQVVTGQHADIARMPYKRPPLDDAAVTTLRAWIAQGATAPADEQPGRFEHWAFSAPKRTAIPQVGKREWLRTPVDAFVLARLEQEKIAPSPEADRVTLLRRVSLDLTGLPPSPAEVKAFTEDRAPDAYERVVERLLASPHYGERWARPWLDVARYADSNGYSIDAPRQIWKYRDWVVNALNRDQPFDQFVIEQLAGDLLPNATRDQRVATGFNRNTQINQEGGIDPEQFRIESVLDRVNTFGTAFLGVTLSCAQCHDHKFDPFTQRDYYRMFAFFNSTVEDGHGRSNPGGTLAFTDELPPKDASSQELETARAELERILDGKRDAIATWIKGLSIEAKVALGGTAREALEIPWAEQTLAHKRALYAAYQPNDADFKSRAAKITRLERNERKPVTTLVMSELPKPRDSFLFIKGDFTRKGEPVTPGTPAILPALKVAEGTRPTRLDLARWLFDPANPLTARVYVNRIWQQYFGRGLIETENDFGTQGSPPSHPELLDWLATELMAKGWSTKAIHRAIVLSATYRQSSRVRPDLEEKDPLNKLLARQTRLRLDAEVVRDVALVASGQFNPKLGGPPVFPPQPDGVMNLGQVKREWKPSTGADRYRRGLYTHLWRATPHPALAVFDGTDGFST